MSNSNDGITAEDEKIVGEAVEVALNHRVEFCLAGEGDDTSLGTATDRAGHMALGTGKGATGDDEVLQLG